MRDPESGKFIARADSLSRKPISVRLPKSLQEQFATAVEKDGRTESEIVREAVTQWLERNQ